MFEKKNGKRFLASVMALVMLLSLAPVGALAVEDEEQNQEVVALPANEADPKPVVTDEENTENTNEELTPPPSNEDYAEMPADNNDDSTAISETLVILNPVDLLNQASEYTTELTWSQSSSTIEKAKFFYLKTPTSNPDSNTNLDWGDCLGEGKIDTSNLYWRDTGINTSLGRVKNAYSVNNNVSEWPSETVTEDTINNCYEIKKNTQHWNDVFQAYKSSIMNELKVTNITEDDISSIILKPYKFSMNNEPDGYHVDCKIEVKCTKTVTATFYVQDASQNQDRYYQVESKNYKTNDTVEFPNYTDKDGYDFSGWYLDEELHDAVSEENHTITENVDFYAKYTPKTYTVTFNSMGGSSVNPQNVEHGTKADEPSAPTKEGYEFQGWYTGEDATASVYDFDTAVTQDITLYAKWDEKNYTVNYNLNYEGATNTLEAKTNVKWGDNGLLPSGNNPGRGGYIFDGWYTQSTGGEKVTDTTTYANIAKNDADISVTLYAHWTEDSAARPTTTDVYVYFKMVDAAGKNIPKIKINNEALKNTVYNKDADGATWATLGKIALTGDITEGTLTNAGDAAQVQLKNADNLWNKNKDIAQTVLANVQWYQLKQWNGAADYVLGGSRWHLDGKITGYTVTYNNGTTEATDAVHNMPDADDMYYLSGSEYTVSDATPTREGYVFTGWKSNIENDTTIYNAKGKFEMPTKNVVLTAQWEKIYTVTFNAGDNGTLGGNLTQTGVYGTRLTEPTKTPNIGYEFVGWVKNGASVTLPNTITEDATYTATWKATEVPPTTAKYTVKHHKWDVAQNKYIEDTSKAQSYDGTIGTEVNVTDKATSYEGYVLNKQVSELKGTVTADNKLTLNLYYDIDKIGETTKENPNGGSDNIPDRYQVTINYVTDNTGRGQITGLTKEVKTIYENGTDGKWASTGTVKATGSTAEATGSRNYFSNWTNKDNTQVGTSATLRELSFDAEGGETYTFTANFYHRSGGGSSRPSTPPTVDIPDDVPTGLNGTDHYAYIIGYGNNDVRPQNNITRAEVATIFFRLLTDETRTANMTKSNGYNDVKDGDWFCCAVSTLSKMGIIKGYEDGSFKPNDPISRAEFAAIAARFDPDGDKTPASFFDVTSHWAKDEISIAANHGWIKGYEDGSFKPDQKITRAETMTLVNRVLNRLPETKDDLHKDMKTWVDNMDETAWYYLAVQEATNSHYFKNKTSTKFEQWTDLRDTRDWSELEK